MLTAIASTGISCFLPDPRARVEVKKVARVGKEGNREIIITHSLSSTYIFREDELFPAPSSNRCIFTQDAREIIHFLPALAGIYSEDIRVPRAVPPPTCVASRRRPRASTRIQASSASPHVPTSSARFDVPALSSVQASSACPHVPTSSARFGVPALSARFSVPALSACPNTSASLASLPVPALSACPHAPASSHHVGAGSNISCKAKQVCDRAPGRDGRKTGQGGPDLAASVNGSFATTYAEDRDGNSRASSFCLVSRRTRRQVPQK